MRQHREGRLELVRAVVGLLLSLALVSSVHFAGRDSLPSEGSAAPDRSCEAEEGRSHAEGWCDSCGAGYLAGVRIESHRLWHTMDAHGHRIRTDLLTCDSCVAAERTDGFCAESRMGFVDGEAYFSRLTWLLAVAPRESSASIACPACRRNAERHGWCERCALGRFGERMYESRNDFENLLSDVGLLERANRTAERCDRCAAAMVTDSICTICRVGYREGRPSADGG